MNPESKHPPVEQFKGNIEDFRKLSDESRDRATKLLINDTIDALLKAESEKSPFSPSQQKALKALAAFILTYLATPPQPPPSLFDRLRDYWKKNVTWKTIVSVILGIVGFCLLGGSVFSQNVRTTIGVQWAYEYFYQDAPASAGTSPAP
ncbi:MAG: hypothetical protein ACK50Q_15665 [Labrys sp. (in: a-proteobacteria)]